MKVNGNLYKQKKDMQKNFRDAGTPGKLRKRRVMRKRCRNIFNIVIIILVCAAVFAYGGKSLYNYFQDTAKVLQPSRDRDDDTIDWESEIADKFDKDIINFVLLGLDQNVSRENNFDTFRPDTIMVISVNFRTNDTNIVSIPRDTYVNIHGFNFNDKINHAYVYGYQQAGADEDPHRTGVRTTTRTIQDFLGGVPIHYYVTVGMDVVEEIVDSAGGVYFDVDMPVRNRAGRGSIVVEEGYQLLDGHQFMHLVRFRAIGGDFGRIERQQDLVVAFFQQVRERGKLQQIPHIYSSLSSNIKTNLSTSQMGALALYGMEVDTSGIESYRFKGSGQYAPRDGMDIYYLVPYEQARVDLIKEVFGVDVPLRRQITLPGRTPEPEPDPETDPETDPDDETDEETVPDEDEEPCEDDERADEGDGQEENGESDEPGEDDPPDENGDDDGDHDEDEDDTPPDDNGDDNGSDDDPPDEDDNNGAEG